MVSPGGYMQKKGAMGPWLSQGVWYNAGMKLILTLI
jgi:hypothetical protein